jgi:DMSO/TMAO reductase YedYZ molybdopterin-dependent catalytic subunit
MPLSRRDLFRSLPGAALAAGLPSRSAAAAEPLIVRMQEPRNLETPLSELLSGDPERLTTRTERFFVRSHFAVPPLDPKTYRLTVEGHVARRLELTLDELKKLPTVSRTILLECAGNGRVFLVPPVRGLQWGHGGVGQATWTGVPLAEVLERAGVKRGAGEVVLVGADTGAVADPPSPGDIPFDRGIPLDKATAPESLLAWDMNDEPLTPAHGAPLRAVIGGWYGMASVKWLCRVVVLDRPHGGYWQTFDYSHWERSGPAPPRLVPLTAIQPKAIVTSVGAGDVLKSGEKRTVSGLAWAGENPVAKVEVSTDAGKTWAAARVEKAEPFRWTRWEFDLTPRERGPLQLLARCTDASGRTQPDRRDPDRRTYMINHLVPVELVVR